MKSVTLMLTTEWVAVAEKFALVVAKLCTRQKKSSMDMISMENELKSLSRRMDLDHHHQIEVDQEVDLVAEEVDLEVDHEVMIEDQDHEVVTEEVEAAAEVAVEVVVDDQEVDHKISKITYLGFILRRLFQIGLTVRVIF